MRDLRNVCTLVTDWEEVDFFYGFLKENGYITHPHAFKLREEQEYNYLSCENGMCRMSGKGNKEVVDIEEFELLISKTKH